ncbi:hypothetical protein BV25DRAFT_1871206 [Artomyces pyxidatus]|uniref:Uncharacterized protein n=1 Tax=Artomyces pyxidatus TaxID=48021 RepID=A0ACB8SV36_9AGAM|nr:hypothetical protein BV25DRAFT_1871206 [Artomyces pyxidatus]
MFCSYTFLPAVLLAISVASLPVKRDVDPSLIPQFGWQSGVNPTGTGNCDGAVDGPNGQPIQIPCDCPPDRDFFIQQLNANVAAGHAVNNPPVEVSFPTDDSVASQLARLNAAAVTLQNLNGTGVGCPVASTDFAAQQAAIEAGLPLPPSVVPISGPAPTSAAPPTTTPSSISSAPSSAPSSPSSTISSTPAPTTSAPASGGLTEDQVAAVAPPLGWESGINPTGTGNCDGAVDDATGHPIEIPCSCPPSQDVYIAQLTANANAGKAINNPTVQLSYPLDNSTASQLTRINAASITLQNLNGPGVGCPIVSTTFSAQANAIQAGCSGQELGAACRPKIDW